MPAEPGIGSRLARAACILLLGAGIAGCETIPQALQDASLGTLLAAKAPSALEALPEPQSRSWPEARADVMNQRARGFGLVNAPEATQYLNTLYTRIKAAAGVSAWQGEVHLLASSTLDAYATAAGNIYVALPWLASAQSEDELVALLAHEFGHVYLHYQSLEGAIANADTAAGYLAVGVAVARKTAQATGWNEVDTLSASYLAGKSLVTAFYGQTQESAADRFALHVSHKLGYSYEHGPKAFLERLAGWEAQNAASDSTATGVSAVESRIRAQLNKAVAMVTSTHPDTLKRQDALAELTDQAPELLTEREPVTAPLRAVLTEARTAQVLSHYELAFKALESPASPEAFGWARQAASGWTEAHAVPVFALYRVAKAQPAAARSLARDAGELLEANIESESDRAWITYTERSARLKDGGRRDAAKRVVERGLAHFGQAEEAMPFAVRFHGETEGWEKAKTMAQACSERFPRAAARCSGAARSPSEVADLQRKEQQKADQLVKKVLKKP